MQKLKSIVTIAGLAALMGAAAPVLAESAPVFDVDTFESANDPQDQDLPLPPAPGEETAGAQAQQQFQQVPQQAQTQPVPDSVGVVSRADAAKPAAKPEAASQGIGAMAPASPKNVGANVGADDSDSPSGVSVSTDNMSPEQRLRRMEQQLTNMQNSQSAAQVNSLQSEVQSLRGQIEQLNHELDTMRAQEKSRLADASGESATDMSANTDSENAAAGASVKKAAKKALAATPAPSKKQLPHASETDDFSGTNLASNSSSASKDQPNVAEEQQIYQTAYDLIKAKKYNEAVEALQGMLKKYPTGQFASNAHYWLGELYGLMGKNDNALDEFMTVINKFPGSPRISDAQLKVGLILAAQSKWPEAKKAFKAVINTYPGTASSRLASEQLKQIKLAGH